MKIKVWFMHYVGGEQGEEEQVVTLENVTGITYDKGQLAIIHGGLDPEIRVFHLKHVTTFRTL